jgi:hypothetical protein
MRNKQEEDLTADYADWRRLLNEQKETKGKKEAIDQTLN